MTDPPEQLELVERYLATAKIAHEYAFATYRLLVELDVEPEHIRKLLAESGAITLQQIPELTRDWRVLERGWFETELLDPANLDGRTQALDARFVELGPALDALLGRQEEIIAELLRLLDSAQREA